MKATAIAPSNIAFIKYWGRKDEELRLPENGSISMNLSDLLTTTTVEFNPSYTHDEMSINGQIEPQEKAEKIVKHLDRVRALANTEHKAKVVSENNFPRGTGLSSSASGFAALTVAATKAAGLNLSEKELSILARQGSGSACRSIPDGFVEWLDGDTSELSYAQTIFPPDHWDIIDFAVILTEEMKDISTSEGQKSARTSQFYELRQKNIRERIEQIKKTIREKDFTTFGEITESDALELHAIMLTSHPSLIYWYPATITIMKCVKKWRKEGLEAYFTMNTGQNIHVLCQKKDAEKLEAQLQAIPEVKQTMRNSSAKGARIIQEHLF